VTEFYAPMLIALVGEAGQPTASALLRVDQQPVVVCLAPVMAIVNVVLGDAKKGPAHQRRPRSALMKTDR
jgi:hypothetical protein